MKDLKSIVKIVENNSQMCLLEIKEGSRIDLIKLGFWGDEEFIRYAKDDDRMITIIRKSGKHEVWDDSIASALCRIKRAIIEEALKQLKINVY